MKKKLLALWVAWLLAWSPNAHAQIDSTKVETNKNLIEAVAKEKTSTDSSVKVINFEDAKRQQELFEKVMKNEKIQELIDEYWQEEVEEMVNQIIANEDIQSVIEDALKDEKIQKAFEEWDQEAVSKRVEEILKEANEPWFWVNVVSRLWTVIIAIMVWELFKKHGK